MGQTATSLATDVIQSASVGSSDLKGHQNQSQGRLVGPDDRQQPAAGDSSAASGISTTANKKKVSGITAINGQIEAAEGASNLSPSWRSPPRSPSWMRYHRDSPPRSPTYRISPSMSPTERYPNDLDDDPMTSSGEDLTSGVGGGYGDYDYVTNIVNPYMVSRDHAPPSSMSSASMMSQSAPAKPARASGGLGGVVSNSDRQVGGGYRHDNDEMTANIDLASYAAAIASNTANLLSMRDGGVMASDGDGSSLLLAGLSPPSPPSPDYDDYDLDEPTPKTIDTQGLRSSAGRQNKMPPVADMLWSPVNDLSPIIDVSPSIERLEQEDMMRGHHEMLQLSPRDGEDDDENQQQATMPTIKRYYSFDNVKDLSKNEWTTAVIEKREDGHKPPDSISPTTSAAEQRGQSDRAAGISQYQQQHKSIMFDEDNNPSSSAPPPVAPKPTVAPRKGRGQLTKTHSNDLSWTDSMLAGEPAEFNNNEFNNNALMDESASLNARYSSSELAAECRSHRGPAPAVAKKPDLLSSVPHDKTASASSSQVVPQHQASRANPSSPYDNIGSRTFSILASSADDANSHLTKNNRSSTVTKTTGDSEKTATGAASVPPVTGDNGSTPVTSSTVVTSGAPAPPPTARKKTPKITRSMSASPPGSGKMYPALERVSLLAICCFFCFLE